MDIARNMARTIDLDIDTGADVVDSKYVPLPSTPFPRPVHLLTPAPSPIKSLSPESRQRCANWKDSFARYRSGLNGEHPLQDDVGSNPRGDSSDVEVLFWYTA